MLSNLLFYAHCVPFYLVLFTLLEDDKSVTFHTCGTIAKCMDTINLV